jgi:PAS domain S-box-containing protein
MVSIMLSQIREKYFETLSSNMEDNVAIVDEKDFTVLTVNKVSAGFKKEEVQGFSILKFISPEYIESFTGILGEVRDKWIALSMEMQVERRTNETGKAWYKCSVIPVMEDNKVVNLIVVSKDITEVKLSEIRMKNKHERLYSIINNTKDIILSIDRDHRLTEYNSTFSDLVEKSSGKRELFGDKVLDYVHPTKHEHLKAIYERVFKGETVIDIEKYPTLANSFLYFETSYNPILDYNNVIIGISIFSKDISDRVYDQQKLVEALKQKKILLSEIHHRIKNNLAMVSSMLHLKEMLIDNEEAKHALSDSRRRIKSTALVHEMLYRNDLFDKISLRDYLEQLFNNLNSDIELVIEGDDTYLNLTKALPFGLMMHELMMNSIKHSFKGRDRSRLTLKPSMQNETLHIDYCDCSGEFPEHVDFYDTSTTGLMLIHTFIEQLDGKIDLVSKKPPSYKIRIPVV